MRGLFIIAVIASLLLIPLISATQTSTLTLNPGWNTISTPLGETMEISDITSACTLGTSGAQSAVWYWDSTSTGTNKWRRHTGEVTTKDKDDVDVTNPIITEIEPGKGYWVYVTDEEGCTLEVGTSIPTPSDCHAMCDDAEYLGTISPSATQLEQDTCNLPKGTYDHYNVIADYEGRLAVTVIPQTNNDLDLYIYDGVSNCNDNTKLAFDNAGGTDPAGVVFDVTEGNTYYIKIKSHNHASYDEEAVGRLDVFKADDE